MGIPAVLARPDLTNATDSGVSPVDDITNFDNATPARAPAFVLTQTLPGATVTVYADGVAIGSAVATATTTTVHAATA